MNAVEFETVSKNGFICIPDDYKDKINWGQRFTFY